MYKILHFRGGIYKFEELSEYVEDVGGLVFNKDHFEIIRGDSPLSTEVHVLLMVPEDELKTVFSIISEIKGIHDDIEITADQRNKFFAFLSIYDALNRNDSWTSKDHLKDFLVCSCLTMPCENNEDDVCILEDNLDEIMEEMYSNDIIESKIEDDTVFYRLKSQNKY
ncbi:MAG: methyl-coenzyme M reductase family protein [Methanobacterium sp.]